MILFEEEACVKALPLLYCKLKGNLNIVVICNYDSYGAKNIVILSKIAANRSPIAIAANIAMLISNAEDILLMPLL